MKQCFWNYIYKAFTNKKKVSLLYLVKGQLIYLYLSNHGWQNHRRVRPNTQSRRLLQVERLNQEPILFEIVRPSIWQLRGSPGTRCLNNSHCSRHPQPHSFRRWRLSVTFQCIWSSRKHKHHPPLNDYLQRNFSTHARISHLFLPHCI